MKTSHLFGGLALTLMLCTGIAGCAASTTTEEAESTGTAGSAMDNSQNPYKPRGDGLGVTEGAACNGAGGDVTVYVGTYQGNKCCGPTACVVCNPGHCHDGTTKP